MLNYKIYDKPRINLDLSILRRDRIRGKMFVYRERKTMFIEKNVLENQYFSITKISFIPNLKPRHTFILNVESRPFLLACKVKAKYKHPK